MPGCGGTPQGSHGGAAAASHPASLLHDLDPQPHVVLPQESNTIMVAEEDVKQVLAMKEEADRLQEQIDTLLQRVEAGQARQEEETRLTAQRDAAEVELIRVCTDLLRSIASLLAGRAPGSSMAWH